MEKDLKAIKKSITIVSSDKDINELITEYINKDYDCFGRAYLKGHVECRQCVIITEYKDFQTGEFRRDPLWVACLETHRFLNEEIKVPQVEKTKEVEPEMQEEIQVQTESPEVLAEKEPEPIEAPVIEKPKRKSANLEGHTKTMYRFCSKCGRKCSMYESTYNNAIKRYGSLEEMNKKYLCKNCRKE